jgi:hypothetical protein
MPKWESSCFIVDDAPQALRTLWWILNSFHHFVFKCFNVHELNLRQGCWPFFLCMKKIVWSKYKVPIFLYAWHVLKAWHLWSMEKIKNKEMWLVIYDDLHKVMYMSINQ